MTGDFFIKNWFMLGLLIVPFLVIIDPTNISVTPGMWLKSNHGPDLVIILIFLFSGMALQTTQLREGFANVKGTILALLLIFIIAPLIAYPFTLLPLPSGLIVGLLLVSVMPTTLSSGVVMTGSSGGNMAHALLITIIANALAVITIPVALGIMLGNGGQDRVIEIDQLAIMVKLATRVLVPLFVGIALRNTLYQLIQSFLSFTTRCNQICILIMVWMAVCAGKSAIISDMDSIVAVIVIVAIFHLLLLVAAFIVTYLAGMAKTKRESIIFMGAQKTLPLSVILQVSLFPEYGIALVVCVMHHIVHLIMDAYLINYLKAKE